MKRLFVLWILVSLVAVAPAQQTRKTSAQRRTTTTKSSRPVKKTTSVKKTASATKVATPKTTTPKKSTPVTVKGLKSEQERVRRQIKEQERRLQANERDVKKRLQTLLVINNEIADKRRAIDTIRHDITKLDDNIHLLRIQLKNLEKELQDRKQRFRKSLNYMYRNRDIQSQMMFVFSANSFSQMYRRLRFVRDYARYQQAQGEAVKSMQMQVQETYDELTSAKRQKNDLLYRGEQEKKSLENKQVEQQNVVQSLKKQQKAIQDILGKQKKRDAELNAQIDRMLERKHVLKQRQNAGLQRRPQKNEQKNWLGRKLLLRLQKERMPVVLQKLRLMRKRLRLMPELQLRKVLPRKPSLNVLPGRQREPAWLLSVKLRQRK